MKRIFSILIVMCLMGQGCVALHYQNEKGIKAQAKDIQIKAVHVEKGKANFWSQVDLWIWFPWGTRISYECESLPAVQ